jgi:hypothetical protein
MAITAITRDFANDPNIVRIITTDNLATITTAGYLTAQQANIRLLNNGDFQWVATDYVLIAYSGGIGFFTPDLTTETFVAGAVVPGSLSDTLASGEIFVGSSLNVATGVALTGDASITNAGVMTIDPTLQLGASGTAASLTMFPPTAANGFFRLLPVNAGGAFNTTISNGVMGQSTVYTIPDIGAATGDLVVSTAAVRMKSVAGAAAAGGAAAQSFTDAFCTTGSNVIGNWNTQANAASVLKIVPGNGTFVVTSSADAGVGTFNYVIMK